MLTGPIDYSIFFIASGSYFMWWRPTQGSNSFYCSCMLRKRYSAKAYSLHFYVQSNYEHGNECVTGKYRSYGRFVYTIVR